MNLGVLLTSVVLLLVIWSNGIIFGKVKTYSVKQARFWISFVLYLRCLVSLLFSHYSYGVLYEY